MFVPRCGAKVMIADIDQAKGQKASKSVREMTKNPNVVFCHVDVKSDESVASMVDSCVRTFGGLRVLVNNAAVFRFNHLRKGIEGYGDGVATDQDWHDSLSTNIIG